MENVTELHKRELILKAVEELYTTIEEDGISTTTLSLNFNPYNWGYKINTTYQSGYPKEKDDEYKPISKRVYDVSR